MSICYSNTVLFGSLLIVSGAIPSAWLVHNKYLWKINKYLWKRKKASKRKKKKRKKMNCSDKRFNYRRAPRTNLGVCLQRRCLEEVRKTGLPGMVQNSPSSKTVTVQFKISKVKRQEIRSVEPRAVHCKNMIQGTRQDIHPLPPLSSLILPRTSHLPHFISSISTSTCNPGAPNPIFLVPSLISAPGT